MESYATIQDIEALWRPLTAAETTKAEALLPVVSDSLRQEAYNVGRNLDNMIEQQPTLASVARSVVVDVVARTLLTSTNSEPLTQFSQSAMGYTVSGTYLVPGGGLYIKKSELKRLGLLNQRYGVIEFYGNSGNNGTARS